MAEPFEPLLDLVRFNLIVAPDTYEFFTGNFTTF